MSTRQPEQKKHLAGKIAIVTGASRGAGRGIAAELGAAGATVYVTGRSTRESPATSYAGLLKQAGRTDLPGSIDETAEEVTRAGGRGIPVRCDHTDEAQVRDLMARVDARAGPAGPAGQQRLGRHTRRSRPPT